MSEEIIINQISSCNIGNFSTYGDAGWDFYQIEIEELCAHANSK
ncbi:MAG: hypothetical protein OEW82_08270 [Dehalococcoidia bacterium]|nr:hypothetical protein [Dehalococcoidia bacterium]